LGKEYEHVAVNCVSFQIAFQGHSMNLDMFDRHWFRTSNGRRHIGLQLRGELRSESSRYRKQIPPNHFALVIVTLS